jgi:hypothetical protein
MDVKVELSSSTSAALAKDPDDGGTHDQDLPKEILMERSQEDIAMFSHSSKRTLRPVGMTIGVIAAVIALTVATPTFAIDGRTAVGICIDSTASGARCAWSVNDEGEIDICNKSGCVYCPSATSECEVARKRPRPTRALPTGTKITTAIGSFEVTRRVYTGPLLKAPVKK